MQSDADAVERWRALASEARAQAEQMTDAQARQIMLNIAEGYDLLARHAESRQRRESQQS
jgi:hypothetical protein